MVDKKIACLTRTLIVNHVNEKAKKISVFVNNGDRVVFEIEGFSVFLSFEESEALVGMLRDAVDQIRDYMTQGSY